MMRSMYSGVSGLRIHQSKMDVIGNNIANVNTTGFKASRVTFNEIFSQTIQGASGPSASLGGINPMQIGLGANISSIDTLMTEGAAQRTDNPLDLKIEGDGFFVVNDAGGFKYTRSGAFRIDQAGNLVSPEGMYVMGWKPDTATGNIAKTKVQKLDILSAGNLYSEPKQTEVMTAAGNIDMNDSQLDPVNGGVPFTSTFYDSLGYRYTAEFSIRENTGTTPPTYEINLDSIKGEDGTTTGISFDATLAKGIVFDSDGKIDLSKGTWPGSTAGEIHIANIKNDNSPATFPSALILDVSSVTLFSGNTTVEANTGDKDGLKGGNPPGSISGFDIGTDGKILGRYTNGQTKLLGQVIVTNFKNPAGLQKVGNNLFDVTTNSGDFDGIGEDISSSGGSLNGGVLEMSNVDLSREFTEMITTQRGFQANSRIITSSDEMLQELVNLKR